MRALTQLLDSHDYPGTIIDINYFTTVQSYCFCLFIGCVFLILWLLL